MGGPGLLRLVKTESNVVANLSPANMMVNLPQGKAPATREENWYLTTDGAKLQELYTLVRTLSDDLRGLPADVRSFRVASDPRRPEARPGGPGGFAAGDQGRI